MDSRAPSNASARFVFATDNLFRFVRINIGIVEQSHLEFPIQHRRDQFVQLRFLENFFADEFDEVQITIRFGELDVHAGLDRQCARFVFVLRDEMAVRVRVDGSIPECA